jgi:phosphatidylglycerol:prolipoprotein diacylglycerol transferase
MDSFIQFPALGINLNIDRVAFSIGGMPVYWYGVIIGIGLLLGTFFANKVAKLKDLPKDTILDIVLFALPVSVICARLYYVIFEWEYYSEHIDQIFSIRNGGIAIYGCIIGGIATGWIYCKVKKISFLKTADCASFGLITGQIIGRWGNFINQEAFGGNTSLPWGMTGSGIAEKLEEMASSGMNVSADLPVHPTFLYESLWNLGVLAVLWFVLKKKHKFDGAEFCTYIALYGVGRFLIEGLRTDSLMLGNVRVSQLVALICVFVGLILVVYSQKKSKKGEI